MNAEILSKARIIGLSHGLNTVLEPGEDPETEERNNAIAREALKDAGRSKEVQELEFEAGIAAGTQVFQGALSLKTAQETYAGIAHVIRDALEEGVRNNNPGRLLGSLKKNAGKPLTRYGAANPRHRQGGKNRRKKGRKK